MDNKPTYEQLENEVRLLKERLKEQEVFNGNLDIIEHLNKIGHWNWDYEKNELTWSDEIYNIFGVNKDDFEVTAENFEKTIHPDDFDNFLTKRNLALEKGENVDIIHRIVKPNGEIRTVQERATVISQENKPIRILGTVQDITEKIKFIEQQKKRRKKEEESENRYKTILATSFDGFWLVNEQGEIVEVNENACSMLGYTREEFVKLSIKDIDNKLSPEEIRNRILEIKEKGKDSFETVHKKKDNTLIDVEISTTYLPYENFSFIAFIKDITEQKRNIRNLKEKNNFINSVVSSSALSTWISDENGTAIMTNPACLDFFGAKEEEVIGKYNLFMDEVIKEQGFLPEIKRVFEKGEVASIIIDYNFKAVSHVEVENATHKIVNSIFTPIIDDRDKVTNVIVQAIDLSNIKRAETELQNAKIKAEQNEKAAFESKQQYIDLVETAQDLIWQCDNKGCFIFLNKAWETTLGYKLEEILGKKFSDFQDPEVAKKDVAKFKQLLKGGEVKGFETTYKAKSGKDVHLVFNSRNYTDNNGNVLGTRGSAYDITERKEWEQKLLETKKIALEHEMQFSLLFENMEQGFALHEMIYDKDNNPVDYKFLLTNKAFKKLTGTHNIELNGKTLKTLFPNIEDVWIEKYGKVAQTGESMSFTHYTKEFDKHYNVIAYSPKKDLFAVVFTDVTENIIYEQELLTAKEKIEKSEERFKLAMAATKDGIWDWNILSSKVFYSLGWMNILGLKEVEPNYNTWFSRLHPDEVDEVNRTIQNHLEGKTEYWELNHRLKTSANKWRWVKGRGKVVKIDDKGQPLRMVGTMTDIEQPKKAEEELIKAKERAENSENRLKALSRATREAIFFSDKGYCIETNEAASRMFGYTYDELIGIFGTDVIAPESKELVKKNMLAGLEEPYDAIALRKDGTKFSAEFQGSMFEYQNKIIRVTAVRDISARKKAEEELIKAKEKAEESDRLKTKFLNNMSHEIRTPMNGILGFTGFLSRKDLSNEKKKHYINIIRNSGSQLLNIIDDILEISRLETKQVKPLNEAVCINDLLLELFSIYDLKAKEKKVPLYVKKNLSDKESTILSDRTKLHKILSNLIDNSLKFTDSGSIEVSYYLDKGNIVIYVKDSGIGISKDKQEYIFERFAQAEKEVSQKSGGLGLGLSIAKENTELLGGTIKIESDFGKGSKFLISIPYTPAHKDCNNIVNKEKKSCSILIVEDEEINYLFIETIISDNMQLDCPIWHATNGLEAIKAIENHPDINLILMDLKMPEMNGFEATKIIKEKRPELPIIAQTAYSRLEEKEKALRAGCDDFISKPINEIELEEKIKKYLLTKKL